MKNKILNIILAASIIVNLGLIIHINRLVSENNQRDLVMIWEADRAIDKALNTSGTIVRQWSELKDVEIVNYLNQIDREIYSAILLLNVADSHFAPLKEFRQYGSVRTIIREGKTDDLLRTYEGKYQDLQYIWKFLAENRIADIGIEEVRLRWDEIESEMDE